MFCSAWGESCFILVQIIILLVLMFYYNQQSIYLILFLPVYGASAWFLASGNVTEEILGTLQASVIPMMLLSRVRYI